MSVVVAIVAASAAAMPIEGQPAVRGAAAALGLGGQNVGIRPGVESATIIWDPGDLQNGYAVLRLLVGPGTMGLLPPGFLPASATSTSDDALSSGMAACYAVLPTMGAPPALAGLSNLVCVLADSRSPSGGPQSFTLRINESGEALLTWEAPLGGGQNGYRLMSSAQSSQVTLLGGSATSATLPLSGLTCFSLSPLSGSIPMGTSDVVCALAGLSTLSAPPPAPTPSLTPAPTATSTPAPTATASSTTTSATPVSTSTGTAFPTLSLSPTDLPTQTPTATSTPTTIPTHTPTPGPTNTPTATPTRTATSTPSSTPLASSPTPAWTPTPTLGAGPLIVGSGGFTSIQAAVNAATPGRTIMIHAGFYPEQVTIDKTVTLIPFGDGDVWIVGQCFRDSAIVIRANDVTVRGLKMRRTQQMGVLIDQGAARATIDGNTIQDFNCLDQDADHYGGVSAWYSGPSQTIVNNLITRRVLDAGPQPGHGDGIWFKSVSSLPSGGGHYIAGNVIVGGHDGIGGEVEADIHGSFDRNTIIENNTVSFCDDDGIQVEGGDANVTVRNNHISECGVGIAFAPNLVGPLFIVGNVITSHTVGILNSLSCMKVGVNGGGTTYINDNVCNIDGSLNGGAGNGIQQTNDTLGVMISRNNKINVTGYAFAFIQTPPAGSSFDNDCMYSTDPTRYIKWNNVVYAHLSSFQTAIGQELHGQTGPC